MWFTRPKKEKFNKLSFLRNKLFHNSHHIITRRKQQRAYIYKRILYIVTIFIMWLSWKSHPSYSLPQCSIKRSSGSDHLREASGPGEAFTELSPWTHIGNPMKGLGPPFIPVNPKPGNCSSIVNQQSNLLWQCQPANKVLNSILFRQLYLAKGQVPRRFMFWVAGKWFQGRRKTQEEKRENNEGCGGHAAEAINGEDEG